MLYVKETAGVVKQYFNDQGQCVKQEFCAGDDVGYSYEGDEINSVHMPFGGNEYFPFNMEQPICEADRKRNKVLAIACKTLSPDAETVGGEGDDIFHLWFPRTETAMRVRLSADETTLENLTNG